MDSLHTQIIQGYSTMDWNAVIAYATSVYAVVSILILWLTKYQYDRSTRPFISVEIDSADISTAVVKPDSVHHITFTLKNSGKLPARNISITCEGIVTYPGKPDSIPTSERLLNMENLALFPGLSKSDFIDIKNNEFLDLVCSPFTIFDIFFKISYKGVRNKYYTTNYIYRYDMDLKIIAPISCHWK
jgi:hypothetical protein